MNGWAKFVVVAGVLVAVGVVATLVLHWGILWRALLGVGIVAVIGAFIGLLIFALVNAKWR